MESNIPLIGNARRTRREALIGEGDVAVGEPGDGWIELRLIGAGTAACIRITPTLFVPLPFTNCRFWKNLPPWKVSKTTAEPPFDVAVASWKVSL